MAAVTVFIDGPVHRLYRDGIRRVHRHGVLYPFERLPKGIHKILLHDVSLIFVKPGILQDKHVIKFESALFPAFFCDQMLSSAPHLAEKERHIVLFLHPVLNIVNKLLQFVPGRRIFGFACIFIHIRPPLICRIVFCLLYRKRYNCQSNDRYLFPVISRIRASGFAVASTHAGTKPLLTAFFTDLILDHAAQ